MYMYIPTNPNKTPPFHVHFVGIGGIGTSALAWWFLAQKWRISGSNLESNTITNLLKKNGVSVKIGHSARNLPPHTHLVIYSTAVPSSNPEIRQAVRMKLPIFSYPQAIGCLTRNYNTIAVAGSHGKSTTTALTALTLIAGKKDPTVIIGTLLKEFGEKNFRNGKSRLLVLEADEWRGAFLHYSPQSVIVTNIDREHLDYYRSLSDIKATFLQFLQQTREGGNLVLNSDDPHLASLAPRISDIAAQRHLQVHWYTRSSRAAEKVRRVIHIPGAHNTSNALAAFTAATKIFRIPSSRALRALATYRGAWRRMELRGVAKLAGTKWALRIIDDYAHHPTEIRATIAALREQAPRTPLICVFQPHQAARLKLLYREFITAFSGADGLIILPPYRVAGRDRHSRSKDSAEQSQKLARDISARTPPRPVLYLDNPSQIQNAIRRICNTFADDPVWKRAKRATVVMMGAGDIVQFTPLLFQS
ncbi:UDP-N-acetylmuramate--L-alanine ligase [Candidatus Parcubacteria bacterium]|nr:MAG: UDP-N-acetylmuramate--L-alanine ligase [Candidatus Parcubacteria bacterium]